MKKIFISLIHLNILICSWAPLLYIIFFCLNEYENSRTTLLQDLLFYIPYLLSLALGIGSMFFLRNIKDHEWAEYIFTKDYFNKLRDEQKNRIVQKHLIEELVEKKLKEYKKNTQKN